jgi:hypothetical protein
MAQHPRLWARGTKPRIDSEPDQTPVKDGTLVAVFYAPDEPIAAWVEDELEQDGARIQTARSMSALMKALVHDPAPHPHVLIIDVDALSPAELMELHEIRHMGWFGSIIALGHTPAELRKSLCIDKVLRPPYLANHLRDAFASLRTPASTIRIQVMRNADR